VKNKYNERMTMKDKRKQMRVRDALPVQIYDVLNNKSFVGTIIDISVGGVSMVTREELPVNTPISLTFTFEDLLYKRLSADVVRETKKDDEQYIGIAFFDLNPRDMNKLDNMIRIVNARNKRALQREHI